MQEENDNLKNLIMPVAAASNTTQDLGLTEKAVKVAEAQSTLRDVLSVTLGNMFAFFALLFPPVIASSLELTARMRGLNKESQEEPK